MLRKFYNDVTLLYTLQGISQANLLHLLVKHFLDTNKPLAAICHGPQILVATGGIQGRKVTAYFAQEPELRAVGADYQKVGVDEAVVDGNLVTGVAWPANPAVIRAFVELLGVKIVHQ